jgi:hypothetical protein
MKKAYYPKKGATAHIDANLLGPCGFNCSFCLAYKNKICLGCRYQAEKSEREGRVVVFCDTLQCPTERGLTKCADCDEYPCNKYDSDGDSIFSELYIKYIRDEARGAKRR